MKSHRGAKRPRGKAEKRSSRRSARRREKRTGYWSEKPNFQAPGASGKQFLRTFLRERDGGCCYICNKALVFDNIKHPLFATLDHIIPKCKGGPLVPWNLKLACKACNNARGAP